MKCEKCGGTTRIIRTKNYNNHVYRERKCQSCASIYYTEEVKQRKSKFWLSVARTNNVAGEQG